MANIRTEIFSETEFDYSRLDLSSFRPVRHAAEIKMKSKKSGVLFTPYTCITLCWIYWVVGYNVVLWPVHHLTELMCFYQFFLLFFNMSPQ